MIDFTDCNINKFKYYGGKNGGKICVIYNNEDYMLKFPSLNEKAINEHEYSNSCISEYISCNIIKTLGLKVQETILGTYKINGNEKISEIINNEEEMDARVFIFPTSALKINDKKINYFEFISNLENEECNRALLRIYPKIDIKKINEIIDDTPSISIVRKEFYKKIIKLRYEKIIKFSYEKLKI